MIPVIAARPDGLGTRLLTILFARQFADRMGANLSVSWPSLEDDNYNDSAHLLKASQVDEIFEHGRIFKNHPGIIFADDTEWSGKRVLLLHGMFDALQNKTPAEVEELCSQFDVLIYDLPFKVAFKGSDATEDAQKIKAYWRDFNFAGDVKKEFSAIANRAQLSDGVAAHVRRGDVVNMITANDLDHLKVHGATQIFQRYIPFDTVINMVKEKFPHALSLTICSEEQEIAERFQKALPGKKIVTSNGVFPYGGNKSALLDLMLLAEAKELVTPFKSYFSDCAATVGRCQIHNAGLDIPNLIPEIMTIIDQRGGADKASRKAIFYTLGYKNLWYLPDAPYRAELLALAKAADPDLVDELMM